MELLPEPGWAKQRMRCHFAYIIEDSGRVFREVHDLAQCQWIEHRAHAFGDVTQRQERQGSVERCDVLVFVDVGDLEHQIAVGDHGALGCAGGA